MTDMLSVAEAKRRFSELIDRVGAGERIVVTRRGRPVLALVPPDEAQLADKPRRLGLAAFAGALADWPEFDEIMREVVASRAQAGTRPAPELD